MEKNPQKRKYHPPQLQKHDTLKDLTLNGPPVGATWWARGTCFEYYSGNGECLYGFDCY